MQNPSTAEAVPTSREQYLIVRSAESLTREAKASCHPEFISGSNINKSNVGWAFSPTSVSDSNPNLQKTVQNNKSRHPTLDAGSDDTIKRLALTTTCERMSKAAFTLAETLITLGIIGVVAALTMPTLIANYQKKVLVTQLKKQVNVMENNFKRIMADEGVDTLCDTAIAYSCNDYGFHMDPKKYKKYFNLYEAPESSIAVKTLKLFDPDVAILQTKDGTALGFFNVFNANVQYIFIDVNGDKGPNMAGRDRFMFYFNNNNSGINFEINDGELELCEIDFSEDLKDANNEEKAGILWFYVGGGCFERIIHDGWQMNY